MEDYPLAWDWEIVYVGGTKRGGALGRTYALERATDAVRTTLSKLPQGATAVNGSITRLGAMNFQEGDRPRIRVEARIYNRLINWDPAAQIPPQGTG